MSGRPNKGMNFEQREIDGSDRKMIITSLIVKCSRCNQQGHNKSTYKMTPTTQPSQANQQSKPSQDNQQTKLSHDSQASQQTQITPIT